MIISDRSRIEAFEKCPRLRYLNYHLYGVGVERTGLSIDLTVGITTHNILHDLWEIAADGAWSDTAMQLVIDQHLTKFVEIIRQRGLSLELASGYEQLEDGTVAVQESNLEFIISLYSNWIQQSVVGWCAIRLPLLLQEYEVINLEQEEELIMAGGQMLFFSRPDAVLRRRLTGELFIVNFKTVGEPNQWWQEQWPLDQQTLSEVLPIEARLGERVSGVLIEGLVKGGKRLQYPPGSGNWYINSPLVWMWKKEAQPPFAPEYAARYEWTDPSDGKSHRLGKGWQKQPAWLDEMGLQGWMEWLHQNEEELLRSQYVQLPPILRSGEACKRWDMSATCQELEVARMLRDVEQGADIDGCFPMHTSGGNCIRPSKCSMYDICHGTAGYDPLHSGYQLRVPNHPKEVEYVQVTLGQPREDNSIRSYGTGRGEPEHA